MPATSPMGSLLTLLKLRPQIHLLLTAADGERQRIADLPLRDKAREGEAVFEALAVDRDDDVPFLKTRFCRRRVFDDAGRLAVCLDQDAVVDRKVILFRER